MTDVAVHRDQAGETGTGEHPYQPGFGNEFASEAVAGALPAGRNSPQRAPLGLYAEQVSGTAFTQPRGVNRRTWVYRIMPAQVDKQTAGELVILFAPSGTLAKTRVRLPGVRTPE